MLDISAPARPIRPPSPPHEDRNGRTIVGYLARREDRPERFALFRPDGTLSNSFAASSNRNEAAALLAVAGLTLRGDDTVVASARPPIYVPEIRGRVV